MLESYMDTVEPRADELFMRFIHSNGALHKFETYPKQLTGARRFIDVTIFTKLIRTQGKTSIEIIKIAFVI